MRTAFEGGLAPLRGFATQFAAQFNLVGGTVVEGIRRIEGHMRFDATQAAIGKVQGLIASGMTAAAAKSAEELTKVERVVLRWGPAAQKAVTVFSGFTKVKNVWDNLGSVVKPLDKVAATSFAKPAAGAAQIAKGFQSSVAPVNTVTQGVKGLGREIALAFGLVGVLYKVVGGVKDFFAGGIKGAIDLNETLSKTNEVFQGSTASVVAQADAMAKAYGLPKGQILDAASGIGLIAKGAKLGTAESAKMANTMAALAADASSFYNVPIDVALEKIRAGLVGEAEPLRAFGVLLSENAVKAEASRLGLSKNSKELSESAKVAARASLIEKGLATANGDLARTADSASNQFRKAGGGLGNFAASVGQLLLPAVQSGVTAFNELLASIVETFEGNQGVIEAWAGKVKEAVDGGAFAVRNFGSVWKVAQLNATGYFANIYAIFDTLPENFSRITAWLARNWQALLVDIVNLSGRYFSYVLDTATDFGASLLDVIKGNGFTFQFQPALEGFERATERLPDLVKPAWVSMADDIDAELGKVAQKELKRSEDLARAKSAAAKKAMDAEDAAAPQKAEHKLAGMAELGTKEAYSAVVKAQGWGKDADLQKVAKVGAQQLGVQQRMAASLDRLAGQRGPTIATVSL